AVKKYGVNEVIESLSSVPVHKYVLPKSVKTIRATALIAVAACCWMVVLTQATSTSHEPDRPISPRGSACLSALPAMTKCEIKGNDKAPASGTALTGSASSITAMSPSSTGDQYMDACVRVFSG